MNPTGLPELPKPSRTSENLDKSTKPREHNFKSNSNDYFLCSLYFLIIPLKGSLLFTVYRMNQLEKSSCRKKLATVSGSVEPAVSTA